jgi:hypothetical protein
MIYVHNHHFLVVVQHHHRTDGDDRVNDLEMMMNDYSIAVVDQ